MSLIRRLGRVAGGAVKGFVTGGGWAGAAVGAASKLRSPPRMPSPTSPPLGLPAPSPRPLPSRGRTMPGGGVMTDVAIGGAGVALGRMTRSAAPGRRRRAKGISGSEFRAFKRVTNILNKVCKTPAPMRRRTGGRSCR